MAVPFNIQAPEKIAKEYGGNKQKIAQAAQMGIVNPTAAVLAGMFIDRMRAAQVMEAGQQPTVAQQVLGGGGVPAPAGPGASATLTPSPPPMMGAQMGAAPPEVPMEEAPMGMAEGGLAGLPVPDAMFDEPDNGGYAGGGLVAFAQGDTVQADPLSWLYSPITSTYGQRRSTGKHSGQDFALRDKTPIGAPAPGRVEKVARDDVNGNFVVVRHPDGTTSSYSHLAAPSVKEGDEVGTGQVIGLSGNTGRVRGKNGGYHLHFGARDAEGNRIDPTSFFNQIAPQVASGKFQPAIPERDIGSAEGRAKSTFDLFEALQSRFGPTEEDKEIRAKRRARAEEMASPEYYEQMRKDAISNALTSMGVGIATSVAPNLMQSIAEGIAAAMPGAQADKKERKALKDRALDALAEMGMEDRKERLQFFGLAAELSEKGMTHERFLKEMEFKETQAAMDRALTREIEKAKLARVPSSDLETMINIQLNGTPQQKAALLKTLELKQKYGSSAAVGETEAVKKVLGLEGEKDSGASREGFSAVRND